MRQSSFPDKPITNEYIDCEWTSESHIMTAGRIDHRARVAAILAAVPQDTPDTGTNVAIFERDTIIHFAYIVQKRLAIITQKTAHSAELSHTTDELLGQVGELIAIGYDEHLAQFLDFASRVLGCDFVFGLVEVVQHAFEVGGVLRWQLKLVL